MTASVFAVIKPIFGAASMGVVRVNNKQQLQQAYERVQKEMAGLRIEAGALVQGTSDDGVSLQSVQPPLSGVALCA